MFFYRRVSFDAYVILSNAYKISVSDVLRIYERQKSEKPGGIYIKEKDAFEQYVLEKILGYGFKLQNYRWIYNGSPVNMGEFFHDFTKPVVAK
ncbi:MAG TPA: hypothetical protein VFD28_02255 [Candidatus Eisenbacteria bacterium]|nr:hypothetical protein [Candidatus Eisenbacteria bacterium]